jgi:hypothetical protein
MSAGIFLVARIGQPQVAAAGTVTRPGTRSSGTDDAARRMPMDMRTRILAMVPVVIAVGSIGCGDPAYHFYAINESPRPLVVMFTLDGASPYAGYELPPNASGDTLQSFGTRWSGTILVLDSGCHRVWQTTIDAGTGGVLISPDGSISWASAGPRWPREAEPPGPLRSTTACDASLRS